MDENWLDETQIAAALTAFTQDRWGTGKSIPEGDAEVLAALLSTAQPALVNASMYQRRSYLRHLVTRIETTELDVARQEQASEPFLDSVCYELACVVKLPTFEHYIAELA